MPRGIHFEIPDTDPERAVEFYKTVFKWEIRKKDGPVEFWLITNGPPTEPGIDAAIMLGTNRTAIGRTYDVLITFSVSSIVEFVRKIVKTGGNVLKPKTVIPGVGYHACVADPEGYEFGIMQSNPMAKRSSGRFCQEATVAL